MTPNTDYRVAQYLRFRVYGSVGVWGFGASAAAAIWSWSLFFNRIPLILVPTRTQVLFDFDATLTVREAGVGFRVFWSSGHARILGSRLFFAALACGPRSCCEAGLERFDYQPGLEQTCWFQLLYRYMYAHRFYQVFRGS